jgi:hypothetical protein
MKCDQVRDRLSLFLYGELSFEEEEHLEEHVDSCSGCREALKRERAMHAAFDATEVSPASDLLLQCRRDFQQRLADAGPVKHSLWPRLRGFFDIRLHAIPAAMQPVAAMALLAVGFFGARFVPTGNVAGFTTAGFASPVASRVRYVEPQSPGRVQIIVDETRQRTLSGSLEDADIQRLLVSASKDPADLGLRVESVGILKGRPESAEVRGALVHALQQDPNAGVRLKALEGLKGFASDPETRKILSQTLLTEKNAGVRIQVIDLLIQSKGDQMVGVLQELMRKEDNNYVRMRCQKALRDMKASVETF